MTNEDISIGSARMLQVLILMFFVSFISFVTYIILTKNPSLEGLVFIIGCTGLALIFIYQAMSYGDLTISGDRLRVKKIIKSKDYPFTDIKTVDRALLPYTFYIEFKNYKKVYFNNISYLDTQRTLKELRLKLNCD
jgi:hypothetical protein